MGQAFFKNYIEDTQGFKYLSKCVAPRIKNKNKRGASID